MLAQMGYKDMTVDEFRSFIDKNDEKNYLLLDVRNPHEYEDAHIPGARNIPLNELVQELESDSNLKESLEDRDLVVHCFAGGRSSVAVALLAEQSLGVKNIYNLLGGIGAWQGKTLADAPKVQLFEPNNSFSDLLYKAMNLEKGAWIFYSYLVKEFADRPFVDTLKELAEAEIAHAYSLYRYWAPMQEDPSPFEKSFEDLDGQILEGGESLETALEKVAQIKDTPCPNLLELALSIEYAAYDLYKAMAEKSDDSQVRKTLLSIAQAEKKHLHLVADAIAQCR